MEKCLTRRAWLGVGLVGLVAPAAARAGPAGRAPQPVLAQEWPPGSDPAGWLVSEKYDGVRALWDGERLRFRSGREIGHVPAAWRARLPQEPLDGELWLGRGRFEAVSALLRRGQADPTAWRDVRYQVFELPAAPGPFSERAARLAQIVAGSGAGFLHAAPQETLADAAALQRRLDAVVAAGGEGLVLHHADAPCQGGRSPWLRKLKPLQDAEAVVIGQRPGRGRLAGRLGALRLRADDGREFALGTGLSDAARDAPPPPGTRVTYSFQCLTDHGLPRFARFVRVAPVF